MTTWGTPLALLNTADPDKVRDAARFVQNLSPQDKELMNTWLVTEAMLAGLFYVLVAVVVFLLGRRIVQALIAAYREAKAQAV